MPTKRRVVFLSAVSGVIGPKKTNAPPPHVKGATGIHVIRRDERVLLRLRTSLRTEDLCYVSYYLPAIKTGDQMVNRKGGLNFLPPKPIKNVHFNTFTLKYTL